MQPQNHSKIIRDLIAEDKIKEALSTLIELCELNNDSNHIDHITALQGDHKNLEDRYHAGQMKEEDFRTSMNELRKNVLYFSRKIKPSDGKIIDPNTINIEVTKTAILIIELEKIKEEFWESTWKERGNILRKLFKYSAHTSPLLAEEIFIFLEDIALATREGLTPDTGSAILHTIINFFPNLEKEDRAFEELVNQAIHIGRFLFLDGTTHLEDFSVGVVGLSILNLIYKKSKRQESKTSIKNIEDEHDKLYAMLIQAMKSKKVRKENIESAIELLNAYKADLDNRTLAYPPMSDHLKDKIYS